MSVIMHFIHSVQHVGTQQLYLEDNVTKHLPIKHQHILSEPQSFPSLMNKFTQC